MGFDLEYKQSIDGINIEYEVIPFAAFNDEESLVDELIKENTEKIAALSEKIEELKVNADSWDYAIAATSGMLSGLIDVFFVGELSLALNMEDCRKIGEKEAEELVKKAAKLTGYKEKDGATLKDAIKYLEKNFPLVSDQKQIKNDFGGALQHHFRDFSHHPTIVGWVFSMVIQYTGYAFGTDTSGMLVWEKVTDTTLIGSNNFEKILFGTVYWLFHMVSDIAGTSNTPGGGTGLPGPMLSLAKEFDSVRVKIKKVFGGDDAADKLTVYLSKLFNGTAIGEKDVNGKVIPGKGIRFDYRTEMGILHNVKEVSKLFLPVVINECIVRSFYFIKHFMIEVRESKMNSFSDFEQLNWKKILPSNNATLTRMITVSVGTMEVIDISDAAIRGAIEANKAGAVGAEAGAAGGPYGAAAGAATASTVAFWKTFALHVNYVGVTRFIISFGSELTFEYKRQKLINERIDAYEETLTMMNAKVSFREHDMWISAEEAGKSIEEAYALIGLSQKVLNDSVTEIQDKIESIEEQAEGAEEKNPGLKKSMLDSLKWGV